MHWIYVLKCENDIIYVGETKKLYSRLHQHMNKRGSKHTTENTPKALIGLYKVHTNYNFFHYCREIESNISDEFSIKNCLENFNVIEWNNKDWARKIEDFITERLLMCNKNVYGGKYVNSNRMELDRQHTNSELSKTPLCHCQIPAEIKLVKHNKYYKLYFTCSLKNVWSNMRDEINCVDINPSCNYYKELLDDLEYRMI
jgi:predicted GIY-YIG superfamily endonuclease